MGTKITFTRDTKPHEGGSHKAGETIEVNAASARRWFLRDAAVSADEAEVKAINAPPADKAIKSPPAKK